MFLLVQRWVWAASLLWVGTLFSSDAAGSTGGRISVENLVFSVALITGFPWRTGQCRTKSGESSQHLVHTQICHECLTWNGCSIDRALESIPFAPSLANGKLSVSWACEAGFLVSKVAMHFLDWFTYQEVCSPVDFLPAGSKTDVKHFKL